MDLQVDLRRHGPARAVVALLAAGLALLILGLLEPVAQPDVLLLKLLHLLLQALDLLLQLFGLLLQSPDQSAGFIVHLHKGLKLTDLPDGTSLAQ